MDNSSAQLVERLRAPAFWCCESDEGHPGDATALVHEAADLIEALTRVQPSTSSVEAVAKRIFLAGHSEGWTGNQTRRDVQHVDAEKGWNLYVENGALAKTLAALPPPEREPMREALEAFAAKAEYADAIGADDDDYIDCAPFRAGDYRKARAALAPPPAQSGDRT